MLRISVPEMNYSSGIKGLFGGKEASKAELAATGH